MNNDGPLGDWDAAGLADVEFIDGTTRRIDVDAIWRTAVGIPSCIVAADGWAYAWATVIRFRWASDPS